MVQYFFITIIYLLLLFITILFNKLNNFKKMYNLCCIEQAIYLLPSKPYPTRRHMI